jgi:hypothetical protein
MLSSPEEDDDENGPGVAVLDEPVSYEDFYRDFLLANRPCLIKDGCGVTADWNCRKDWVRIRVWHEYLVVISLVLGI